MVRQFVFARERLTVSRGFTLIELLVVISIVGIFAFMPVVDIPLQTTPITFTKLFSNADTMPDLAVLRDAGSLGTTAYVQLFLGSGVNSLIPSATIPVPARTRDIASARLYSNSPGDDIAAVVDNETGFGSAQILKNLGNGQYQVQPPINLNLEHPAKVALADLNGDGRQEIIAASRLSSEGFSISVAYGNASSWTPGTRLSFSGQAAGVQQLRRNPDEDSQQSDSGSSEQEGEASVDSTRILVSGDITLPKAPGGAIKPSSDDGEMVQLSLGGLNGLTVADLNGDGRPDVVVAGGDYSAPMFAVFYGTTAGLNQFPVVTPVLGADVIDAMAVADFDHNGFQDLAFTDSVNNVVRIVPNYGPQGFGTPRVIPTGDTPVNLAIADFDADGFADLAVATQFAAIGNLRSAVTVLMNTQSNINFIASNPAVGEYGAGPIAVAAGDFDRSTPFQDFVTLKAFPGMITLSRNLKLS